MIEYPYFSESELSCKCGKCDKEHDMDEESMYAIVNIREEAGFPMNLSSAFRCRKHPAEVRKTTPGTHNEGKAVDVLIYGARALKLIELALKYSATGIGISQRCKDKSKRFIHIDFSEANETRPRPWIWSY